MPYPKIELHVHLEATLRPERLLDIAQRIDPTSNAPTSTNRLSCSPTTLVGIDSVNIHGTHAGERPVHSALLAAGIPIVVRLGDPTSRVGLAPLPTSTSAS
jgi:hypothetical protein